MKLCINCVCGVKDSNILDYYKCKHPKSERTNPIDGSISYVACNIFRMTNWFDSRLLGYCGKEGRFYIEKGGDY